MRRRKSVAGAAASAAVHHPAARLAEMVLHVIEDYRAFAAAPPEENDTKAFAARHAACRAALAHLEHLLRLTRAMGGGEPAASRDAALIQAEAALAEARNEMALLPPCEEGEEEMEYAGTDAAGRLP